MEKSKRYYDIIDRFQTTVEAQRKLIEELKRILNTDKLTGLYSEAFMNSEAMILDSRRENIPPYAIAMIDVDSFKESANDEYGHGVGDEVLKIVAKSVLETFRPGDSCCRPSGDEFVVIMPELNQKIDIKRFPKTIEGRLITHIHQKFDEELSDYPKLKNIGMSVGIATSNEKNSFNSIKNLADQRMYKSKKSKGVNR